MHGDRRIPLHRLLTLEPLHPSQDGVDAAAGPHRLHHLQDQPRHLVGVAGGLGVVDGRLLQPVGLAPGRGPPVQLRDQLGLAPPELGTEQVAEQVVVAVPLPSAVERDQEEIGPGERLQHRGRAGRVQDRVAQRAAHPVQHGRPGEERHLPGGKSRQQLRVQVVDDEPVVPGEGHPGSWRVRGRTGGLECEGGQVQPDRPALGPAVQLGRVLPGQAHLGPLQQRPGLARVHGQVSGSHLHQPALATQPPKGQPRLGAGGQGELGVAGELQRELRERVQALAVVEQFDVVKDQGDGFGRRRHGSGQSGHDRRWNVGGRRGQDLEGLRFERRDPVQRHRQVGQQHRRVVVVGVDRQPADPATLALGPLGQQGRLAVAGRRHHTDHRPARCRQQSFDQRGAGHHPWTQPWRVQLGLDELERRSVPGTPALR